MQFLILPCGIVHWLNISGKQFRNMYQELQKFMSSDLEIPLLGNVFIIMTFVEVNKKRERRNDPNDL